MDDELDICQIFDDLYFDEQQTTRAANDDARSGTSSDMKQRQLRKQRRYEMLIFAYTNIVNFISDYCTFLRVITVIRCSYQQKWSVYGES